MPGAWGQLAGAQRPGAYGSPVPIGSGALRARCSLSAPPPPATGGHAARAGRAGHAGAAERDVPARGQVRRRQAGARPARRSALLLACRPLPRAHCSPAGPAASACRRGSAPRTAQPRPPPEPEPEPEPAPQVWRLLGAPAAGGLPAGGAAAGRALRPQRQVQAVAAAGAAGVGEARQECGWVGCKGGGGLLHRLPAFTSSSAGAPLECGARCGLHCRDGLAAALAPRLLAAPAQTLAPPAASPRVRTSAAAAG